MAKIHFLCFGDSKMQPSLRRIEREARETGWFDTVTVINEHWFDKDYLQLVKPTLYMRGFGYMRWKSYVVRRKMKEIDDGDIIFYADAGCTINRNGHARFKEYIQLVNKNEAGMLFFEHEKEYERTWTKMDLLVYTNYQGNKKQLWSGGFILRKTPKTVDFSEKWYDLCNNHFELITDSPSILPNDPSFVENRHDQSALSVLGRKYDAVVLSVNENYTTGDFSKDLPLSPLWATRKRRFTWCGLKKMGLKKRFPKLFGKLY